VRRTDRRWRFLAGIAALALVVPVSLVERAPAPVAGAATRTVAGTASAGALRDRLPHVAADGPLERSSAAEPVASATTLSLPVGIAVFGHPFSVHVDVAPGGAPVGAVQVLVDGEPVATGEPAADGTVRVPLPASLAVGTHTLTAVSAGVPQSEPPVLGSSSAPRTLTVTQTLPSVRADGTDWSVRRMDPKAIHIQVLGTAGVRPTGRVAVWVNGSREGSATLDPSGDAVVTLATTTRTSLVVVTYGGDATYLPWLASPRVLIVR